MKLVDVWFYRRGFVLLGALLWASAAALSADLSLDADFDSGALLTDEVEISGDTVLLKGPDNLYPGRWKWLHFRVEGAEERRLRFRIDDNFAAGGGGRLDGKKMVYREAESDWEFFDNNVWNREAGHFTFYNDEAFGADTVFVAYSFPYPFQRVADHIETLEKNPWVFPTPSSGTDLVIGKSPGGTDDRGREIEPRPLYGYRLTDPDGVSEKVRVVLCSGVHPNEVLAGYVLEGLVDWLLSDDFRAAYLRRYAEFFVYPMVNPDGRFAGYNRGGVQHISRDANRYWREDLYSDMDDIRQIAEAMKRDTGAERVRWVIDFHSWTNTLDHFVIMNPEAADTLFWKELKRLEPDMGSDITDSEPDLPRTRGFALRSLGAEFALVAETMFRPGEYPDRYLAMGERFGIALFEDLKAMNRD